VGCGGVECFQGACGAAHVPRRGRGRVSSDQTGRSAAFNQPAVCDVVAIPIEPTGPVDPRAIEFVRFCYHLRRVSWPELYDDMCAVAARGSFCGMAYEDLEKLGLRFTLGGLSGLIALAQRIVAEERRDARMSSLASRTPSPISAQFAPASGR
jgi:hypothetical protein